MDSRNEQKIVKNLSVVGIGGNIILTTFKFFAGIVGNSTAMLSDAVHSLSDVVATLIAYIGVRMSMRAEDKTHPYGHERLECVASLMLGVILVVTGFAIGWTGIEKILAGNHESIEVPGMIALVAAVVSIVVKEAMYWYTRHYAKILNSSAFMADAWHHRSDALSSVGALLGIGAAMMGFPVADPIASVIICLFIMKVAYDVLKDALDKMVDTPCNEETEQLIAETITSQEGVIHLDRLQTRQFGNRIYVDAEIAVDGNMPLRDAHAIAHKAHDKVEKKFPNVKHIMIHVNPA